MAEVDTVNDLILIFKFGIYQCRVRTYVSVSMCMSVSMFNSSANMASFRLIIISNK